MARKRKADHDTAIAGALELFWRKGYAGASTREIEEETGLTRFMLQTAYGGKESFFLETLDAYLDRAEAQVFPDETKSGLEELAGWFEWISDPERMPLVGECGCLAFNSIGQFDRSDEEVNKRLERYLSALQSRFRVILKTEIERGKAAPGLDADDAAQVLLSLVLGLHSIFRARTDDRIALSYARSASALVRSWSAR